MHIAQPLKSSSLKSQCSKIVISQCNKSLSSTGDMSNMSLNKTKIQIRKTSITHNIKKIGSKPSSAETSFVFFWGNF